MQHAHRIQPMLAIALRWPRRACWCGAFRQSGRSFSIGCRRTLALRGWSWRRRWFGSAAVRKAGVPLFVGFNRRFDPSFSTLRSRVARGDVGNVEQVIISSRDPGLPPISYIKVSGGQFRDMTIHDFDLARWLLGEEPVELFAYGSCQIGRAHV